MGGHSRKCPAATPRTDVNVVPDVGLEYNVRADQKRVLGKELAEVGVGGRGQSSQIVDQKPALNCCSSLHEGSRAQFPARSCPGVSRSLAASSGKPSFERTLNLSACPPNHRPIANVEPIFRVRLANEIEHCEHALARRPSKPSTQLLKEDRRAFRRSKSRIVSISGMSTPSLNMSTVKIARSSPRRSLLIAWRLSLGVSPSRATEGNPPSELPP